MNNILITGATGQLGQELCKLLEQNDITYIATGSKDLDITNSDMVFDYIKSKSPKYIIHCAAYTAVDMAEVDGSKENWKVNALGTEYVAKAAEASDATLIYISTDYVFDGKNTSEYTEVDEVNPLNEYGKAKLAGERAVQKFCTKHYIIRTSWVFGKYGKNFVYTMLNLADSHDKLTIVADQYGRPTWTKTIAEFILFIYKNVPEFGVYHLSNEGSCSWYEFASKILEHNKIELRAITSNEYPQQAKRPQHAIMSLEKTKKTGFSIISWENALNQFMHLIN